MNEILRAKIEACLLLSTSAKGFRYNCKVVCGLTKEGFHSTSVCATIYGMLDQGDKPADIYSKWCREEIV